MLKKKKDKKKKKKTNGSTPIDDHTLHRDTSSWFWNTAEQKTISISSPRPPPQLSPHMTGTCRWPAGDPAPPPCRISFSHSAGGGGGKVEKRKSLPLSSGGKVFIDVLFPIRWGDEIGRSWPFKVWDPTRMFEWKIYICRQICQAFYVIWKWKNDRLWVYGFENWVPT